MIKIICLTAVFSIAVNAKVYLNEPFNNQLDKWVSTASSGKFEVTSGTYYGDLEINKGLSTTQDARYYAISRHLENPLSTNKGQSYVVSFSLQNEQTLECGGGYLKFLYQVEPKDFTGDTPYHLMFGPDKCGATNRIHIIFNYKGRNIEWKKFVAFPLDKKTHVYTLAVHADNTYFLYVDGDQKETGSLEKDWDFLLPKEIDDPTDKKPIDWVDEPMMNDENDKKPDDWDKEPKQIADPKAQKPEDWDDEEDGIWEAPMVANPNYKGEWKAKQVENPKYKGEWKPKQIPNPKYEYDADLYLITKPITQVGVDVWQVQSGSIFDNIIVADTLDEVNTIVDATWGITKTKEEATIAEAEEKEKKDAVAEDDKRSKEDEEENKKADSEVKEDDKSDEKEDQKEDL